MNIAEILSRHNVPHQLPPHRHVRQGWVGVDCPECSPHSGKFKLGFEISTGRTHCWSCGILNGVEILSRLCRIEPREAAGIWHEMPKRLIPAQEKEHTGHLKLPRSTDLQVAHKLYLRGRGFDPDEIVQVWGISGIGIDSRLPWRILIPIHNRMGRVVSWTTRSINPNSEQRYWSAKEEEESVPHKHILYGAHLARNAIVIVEGPLDAWAIGPGAVATCGTGFSSQQLAAMSEYTVRAVCFDMEAAAQHRAEQLCKQLAALPGLTENVLLETGSDPPEASPAEIEEIRDRYLYQLA